MLKVSERDYDVIVTAEGELTGLGNTSVSAPQVRTGSLKIGWMVKEGAIVQKGDPIVRFDNSNAVLKLKENENAVDSVKSRITKSEEDGRSQKTVYGLDGRSARNGSRVRTGTVPQRPGHLLPLGNRGIDYQRRLGRLQKREHRKERVAERDLESGRPWDTRNRPPQS